MSEVGLSQLFLPSVPFLYLPARRCPGEGMLTKDAFSELISRSAGVRRQDVHFHSRLVADLGLDSFALMELCSALADLGVDVGEQDWLATGTVGELYDRCRDSGSLNGGSRGGMALTAPEAASSSCPKPAHAASEDAAPDDVAPPELVGRFFRLRPVLPQAVPFLYELAIMPDVGFRWRYRGAVPSYEKFEADLWQGILIQFVVESLDTGQPAGHVICYNPDFGLGHAYVGAAMASRYRSSGIAVEPVRIFIRYLFDVWPFQKLYFELPEFNYRQFASAANGVLHVEARLRNHDYYRGRRWDRLILAVYRDAEGPSAEAADCCNGFLPAGPSRA